MMTQKEECKSCAQNCEKCARIVLMIQAIEIKVKLGADPNELKELEARVEASKN
jgi:hypothetical protein